MGFHGPLDSSTALFSVILIDTWVYTPFVLLLILAGLQGLPKSPYESAMIDGGSAWFTFKTLTLPLLKPVILITLIFRLCAAIQEFSIIYSTTKGGPGDTLIEPVTQCLSGCIHIFQYRKSSSPDISLVGDHKFL